MFRRSLVGIAFFAIATTAACATDGPVHNSQRGGTSEPQTLTVFAAASLTDAFTVIATDFEKANPGVKVVLNFAGSQSLRTQVEHGARADVFASANAKHIQALTEAKLVTSSRSFATNRMVIVTPADNPGSIARLEDLATGERVVFAGANVPAGTYAETVLRKAAAQAGADFHKRVLANVVSRELDVRQTLQKVVLGEANAAIVYATDAASAGANVRVFDIPDQFNVLADYPVAILADAERPGLARRFVDHLASTAGAGRLEEFGFQARR